jgi:hypothetical protein
MVQIVQSKLKTKTVTLVDNIALTVPATGTVTVNSDAFDISGYETAIFLVTLGTETATATFDAKLQYEDSNGNFYDVTSGAITQMTAAGSQQLLISKLYGETARVVYVYGDAENDSFAGVTLELVLKS